MISRSGRCASTAPSASTKPSGAGAAHAAARDVGDPERLALGEHRLVEAASPKSFTITAIFSPERWASCARIAVVFPAPRNPEKIWTGIRATSRAACRTASASSVNSGSVRSQLMHLSVMLWPYTSAPRVFSWFWLPSTRKLSSITPMIAVLPSAIWPAMSLTTSGWRCGPCRCSRGCSRSSGARAGPRSRGRRPRARRRRRQ
jgi:hypothetical protein